VNIDSIKFLNIEHDSFRELEHFFTEKYFTLIDRIKSGELSADDLVKFHSDILQVINEAEEKIISLLLDQASREKLAEIFKN
jgi:hypothetical protein